MTGCGASLPPVQPRADPTFLHGGSPVGSIDVLPVDVQIWAHAGSSRAPEEIAAEFDQVAGGSITTLLASRGYRVHALGWDGRYLSEAGMLAPAMGEREIAETVYALSGYGQAMDRAGYTPLAPHLPHRLGAATRADATLYIGGWAYSGKKGMSTGKKVAIGVGIALVAAVIVIAVIASAKGGGGKGGGGGGGGLGGAAHAVGRSGGSALRVAGRMVGGVGRAMVRTTAEIARASANGHIHIEIPGDCYGRVETHTDLYPQRPDWYAQTGRRSGKSAMMIEMTLVDNRTGQSLWHARQKFGLNPARPHDVQRALGRMLASIPVAN